MTTRDTGGPAFPNRGDNSPGHFNYDGMTLEDWFAGQALSANWWADLKMKVPPNPDTGEPAPGRQAKPQEVAASCYIIAAAMVAERARRNASDDGGPKQ